MPDRRGRRGRVALDAAPHRIASLTPMPMPSIARKSSSSWRRAWKLPVTIAHDGKESTPSHSVQAISTDALGTDSPYVIATGTFRFSPLATSGAGDTVSRIGTRIHRLASNAA
ncbi:ferredoxin-NADP reductase [Burkholderia pseudomallei]|uniref:ferredoxin-NADP reductase n=2 Tax=Burkholderia pseudomallei TaxID=28450 RepID=UPI0012AED3BE|nr:ferredoxin-NADP reductase [Burkholderia pseudomallei]